MSAWGGLVVADLLELVEYLGLLDPGADGDLELAEALQPVAETHEVYLPNEDSQLLAVARKYGRPVGVQTRGAIVLVDGLRPGVSAGQPGVIESDGECLYLAQWDLERRHSGGWLVPGMTSLGSVV